MEKGLEKKAKEVIIRAYETFPHNKTFVAWTGRKDSTVLLHLIRSIFDNKVPFPVMFNDSTMEFEDIYQFIKKISKEWQLDLRIIRHDQKQLSEFYHTKELKRKKELSRLMKIHSIKRFVKENDVAAFLVAIRWDEHPARSKEEYFSPREDHMRIHPILHFTEKDIWDYIRHYNVPYVKLYDQGYRSLGEKPFTRPVKDGQGERAGLEYDKEQLMDKLRNMGYW